MAAVASGVKRGFLNDYFVASDASWVSFLNSLHQEEGFKELMLISLDDNLKYVVHRTWSIQEIQDHLQHGLRQNVFIDISKFLQSPKICSTRQPALEFALTELKSQLEKMDPVAHPILAFILPQQISLIALSGFLIGYPVVFITEKNDDADAGNCLAGIPLNICMVYITLKLPPGFPPTIPTQDDPRKRKEKALNKQPGSLEEDGEGRILSFSYPASFEEKVKDVIQAFQQRFHEKMANQAILKSFRVVKTTDITLDRVAV